MLVFTETEKSTDVDAEVSLKFPPVDEDITTTTLPAFTLSESAVEPDVIVRVSTGEVRVTGVLTLKLSGAATAALIEKSASILHAVMPSNSPL